MTSKQLIQSLCAENTGIAWVLAHQSKLIQPNGVHEVCIATTALQTKHHVPECDAFYKQVLSLVAPELRAECIRLGCLLAEVLVKDPSATPQTVLEGLRRNVVFGPN